jgi:hypothetical protein
LILDGLQNVLRVDVDAALLVVAPAMKIRLRYATVPLKRGVFAGFLLLG